MLCLISKLPHLHDIVASVVAANVSVDCALLRWERVSCTVAVGWNKWFVKC